MATPTKTSLENVSLFHVCYFGIISTFTETSNCPGAKLVGVVFKFKIENRKITVVCSHFPQNLEFGHFTLLF